MEIKNARVLHILPAEQGQSARGAWTKQIVVFEYGEQYPQTVAVEFFNKSHIAGLLFVGGLFNIYIQPTSREYQGKWFSQISAWKVEAVGQPQQQYPPQYPPQQPQQPQQPQYGQPQQPQQPTPYPQQPQQQQQYPQPQQVSPLKGPDDLPF